MKTTIGSTSKRETQSLEAPHNGNHESLCDSSQRYWMLASVGILIALVFVLNHSKIQSNDAWWHIKLGQWMVENGSIYKNEIFSKTLKGQPFVAHEWLSEIVFYLVADKNAVTLSYFKLGLMMIGSIGFGWLFFRPYWFGAATYPVMVALIYLMSFRAHHRPQLFGMWFTVGLVYAIDAIETWRTQKSVDSKKSVKCLLWFLPFQALWTNFHGSFLLGPIFVALLALSAFVMERLKPCPGDQACLIPKRTWLALLGISGLYGLATLVNPFGSELMVKAVEVFFRDNYMKDSIREWIPIHKIEKGYWFYVWISWIGFGWWLLYKRFRDVTFLDLGVMITATLFPFAGTRYLTLSALISFPQILRFSHELWPRGFNPRLMSLLLLPFVIYVGIYGNPYSPKEHKIPGAGFNYEQVPLEIMEHIKVHKLGGVMMNHYDDGAYILYYLYPDVLTVMDSRTDSYGKELYEEHRDAYATLSAFSKYVAKYDVNLVMVQLGDLYEPLRSALFNDPSWNVEKIGLTHVLFSKIPPGTNAPTMEELNTMLRASAEQAGKHITNIDAQVRNCLFVRLYGLCGQVAECQSECTLQDPAIAAALGMPNPLCLRFLQACYKKETACGNCYDMCRHYREAMPWINQKLSRTFPQAQDCSAR